MAYLTISETVLPLASTDHLDILFSLGMAKIPVEFTKNVWLLFKHRVHSVSVCDDELLFGHRLIYFSLLDRL